MKKILYATALSVLCSCSGSTQKQETTEARNNVIDLKEAIAHQAEEMKLSEFVDSIVFVPMPDEPLVRDRRLISYSKPYLDVFPGRLFDLQGNFIGYIGSLGQGPGEETNGWGFSVYYDEVNDLHYTKGDKIIQYDKNRKFTGKEVRVTYRDKETGTLPTGLKSPYAFVRAGKYNMLVNYPDSAYWMNKDLQIVHKQRLIPEDLIHTSPSGRVLVGYTFSTYNDTTLFFNCFTDELCSVNEDKLQRRWKIELGDLKADSKHFLNGLSDYEKELKKIIRSEGGGDWGAIKNMAANSEFAEKIDGKHWIGQVYESGRYVWIGYRKLYAFEEWRNIKNQSHWAIFDKQTGEVKTAPKFVNDMDGFVDFTPSMENIIGINNGVLMASIWPYELKDHVSWEKKNNKPIDPRLVELAEASHEESNPILVYAYLKK